MRRALVSLLTACLAGSCAAPAQPPGAPPAWQPPPTLIVFITVDQFHPGYLDRFRPQFTGGLARLLDGGAFFTNAFQDYAITETAPGHASTMSGRFPRSTGITRNLRGVNTRDWPLIDGARGPGAAPFRFRGTTLTDWLVAKDARTKVLSVSQKDRGAILPIGRSKQQVYWYASNGAYTTSTWYRDTLPAWVRAFNGRGIPRASAGQVWDLLLPRDSYPEADSVPVENGGRNIAFPHLLPADSAVAARAFPNVPMMDATSAAFALEGLERLGLGTGPETDLLAVSFSATDHIGHRYGPESVEIHDQILRLDRTIGRFIDSLYRLRDSSRILIALTADHAVTPIPALHGKLRVNLKHALAAARAAIVRAGGDTTAADLESGAFFAPDRGHDPAIEAFVTAARQTPGVARVDRWSDLPRADTTTDTIARRWLHMFPADLAPDVVVSLAPGNIWDYPIIATHGTPNDADAHVPILLYGPPIEPGRYPEFARTVDIAPTLAAIVGAPPTEKLDGHVLSAAVR